MFSRNNVAQSIANYCSNTWSSIQGRSRGYDSANNPLTLTTSSRALQLTPESDYVRPLTERVLKSIHKELPALVDTTKAAVKRLLNFEKAMENKPYDAKYIDEEVMMMQEILRQLEPFRLCIKDTSLQDEIDAILSKDCNGITLEKVLHNYFSKSISEYDDLEAKNACLQQLMAVLVLCKQVKTCIKNGQWKDAVCRDDSWKLTASTRPLASGEKRSPLNKNKRKCISQQIDGIACDVSKSAQFKSKNLVESQLERELLVFGANLDYAINVLKDTSLEDDIQKCLTESCGNGLTLKEILYCCKERLTLSDDFHKDASVVKQCFIQMDNIIDLLNKAAININKHWVEKGS